MPGLTLFFWLIVALVFGAACAVCIGLLLRGRRRKSRFLQWAVGVPLVILTGLLLLFIGVIVRERIRASVPRYVFADELGQPPNVLVTDLRSDVKLKWSSKVVHLRFHCPPDEFAKLVPKELRRLKVRDYPDFGIFRRDTAHPGWWAVNLKANLEVHGLRDEHGEHLVEERVLIYDPANRTAQYYYLSLE